MCLAYTCQQAHFELMGEGNILISEGLLACSNKQLPLVSLVGVVKAVHLCIYVTIRGEDIL